MPPLAATMRWVDRLIIGQNLCPYTKAVRRRPEALRCVVSKAADAETLLADVDAEVEALRSGQGETSLLVLPPSTPWGAELHGDFAKFMSFGWKVEERLAPPDADSMALQLALFHPKALRNLYSMGEEEEAADYAMRSPHPTIHLLRVSDVAAVPPKSAAAVPERNRAALEALGVPRLRELLASTHSS